MKTKILFALTLLCCIYANSFAQPVIKAQKTIGGNAEDFMTCMSFTKDGGLIMGGYSTSLISGEKTQNPKGGYDYWLVKLDKTGAIQWNKTIGGNLDDFMSCIQPTADGGYIVGGNSRSSISGDKSENSRGSDDYWIVKIDNAGNKQWDKTIGGGSRDFMEDIKLTADGGYILGGYSLSNASGEKTENSRGYSDYWIVKTDSAGNIQWDKTIGGNESDNFSSILQNSDGGYLAGGFSYSDISGEKTENSNGADYWLVKLNAVGEIIWDNTIGGNEEEYFGDVVQTTDGGYLVGGYSTSGISGDKTESNRGPAGTFDYWAVKLNSTGNIQANKTLGGSGDDFLTSLKQTQDGGYILGGSSSSDISGEKTENSRGDFDYWIIKLSKSGAIQWNKTIGGNKGDFVSNIKEISSNNYLAGGNSYSDISGEKSDSSRGDIDYWVIQLKNSGQADLPISLSQPDNITKPSVAKDFLVYPNPAKDILHIQNTGKAIFTLTNQSGKQILTKTINGNGEINVAHLATGIYYLKNTETGAVQKVIVTK